MRGRIVGGLHDWVRSQVGADLTGGVLVPAIPPGSVVEKLGLRSGDRVRAAAGRPVTSLDALMDSVLALAGDGVTLSLDRGGREVTLSYRWQSLAR